MSHVKLFLDQIKVYLVGLHIFIKWFKRVPPLINLTSSTHRNSGFIGSVVEPGHLSVILPDPQGGSDVGRFHFFLSMFSSSCYLKNMVYF